MWGAPGGRYTLRRDRHAASRGCPEAGGASGWSRSPMQSGISRSPRAPMPLSGRCPWPAMPLGALARQSHLRRHELSAYRLPPFMAQNRWYRGSITPKMLILRPELGLTTLPQIRRAATVSVPPPRRILTPRIRGFPASFHGANHPRPLTLAERPAVKRGGIALGIRSINCTNQSRKPCGTRSVRPRRQLLGIHPRMWISIEAGSGARSPRRSVIRPHDPVPRR